MKIYFYFNNIFIYTFIYFLLIQNIISKEINYDISIFENKTIDHLRQIFWTTINSIDDINKKNNYIYENENILHSKSYIEIKNNLIEIFDKINDENKIELLIENIKKNKYFTFNNITDFKNFIQKNDLPKNFLINFAFNIDKYDRTEREVINSESDFIKFYKREQLINLINNKLDEYKFNVSQIKEIVLNNIDNFYFNDIKSYLSKKNKNELVQIIYGFEYFCYNTEISDKDGCYVAYHLYNHRNLEKYTRDDLNLYLSNYIKKLNIEYAIEDFIFYIENRGFTYPNNNELIKQLKSKQDSIIAFETYYRRQINNTNSLKYLTNYINKFSTEKIKDILDWGISLYPELGDKYIFDDITASETYLQYGQVKQFVKVKKRDELLKFVYNIHTYQNNITSIYNNETFNILRMSDNMLYNQIFNDTNKNKVLQLKKNFEIYANLHNNNLNMFFKNLQRNQLKIYILSFIQLFYKDKSGIKIPSEKKAIIDSISNLNNDELINTAMEYAQKIKILTTEDLRNFEGDQRIYNPYFSFYENIMDFLRSTDINYLRLWLRKYELIIRKRKSEKYLSGGLKTNFMNINEYTKNEILKVFDIYIYEYPELFNPDQFIKLVGLDRDETPHRYLVENIHNKDLIKKISFSIVGHLQRKNIQTNFNESTFLSIILSNTVNNDNDDNNYIKNRFLYQLFRIINIFPELNNKLFFEKMCINDETKIINGNDIDINKLEDYIKLVKNRINEIANNIEYYYKKTKPDKTRNNDYNAYLREFLLDPDIINDDTLKCRILDGDFYPIFYDYSLFLKDEKDVVIDNIFNKLSLKYNYALKDNEKNDTQKKREAINIIINKYEELQDPSFFDLNYNTIDLNSEILDNSNVKNLYEFLIRSDNRKIFYYCLIANIMKMNYQNKYKVDKNIKIKDIYLKIHFMSRISMIRYILEVASYNVELRENLDIEKLPKLIKKYMLDIGSDNIYDLTLY